MVISNTVVNVYPTLDKWLPTPNNKCIELDEGHSTELTCTYTASTDPNITIPTWKFNEELIRHDSNHYTITTYYGNDPININHVFSKLTLSKATHDNTGTYTCQCAYNRMSIDSDNPHKNIVSNPVSFCIKVKPG